MISSGFGIRVDGSVMGARLAGQDIVCNGRMYYADCTLQKILFAAMPCRGCRAFFGCYLL